MAFDFFSDPRTMGLLGMAGGLLQASGPSRLPVSLGQAAGQGLLQGASLASLGLENQQRQAQLQALQRQQQAINSFGASLPPDEQGRFYADPGAYIKSLTEGFTLKPGETRYRGNQPVATLPQAPSLVDLPVQGQPGVSQPTWMTPGATQGTPVGGQKQPDILNPAVQQARIDVAKAGATQVNVGPTGVDYGKPPEGMAWARNQDGSVALKMGPQGFLQPIAVPIAGGPVESKEKKEAEAKAEQQRNAARYADVVTTDVDRALSLVRESSVPLTGLGSLASAVPGTPAHNLSNLLNTIKANVGFDRLQQMRAASPTGGALGQVSEFENKLLQATIGALEQSQGKEQFLYNLQRVQDLYLDIIHGPGNRPTGGKPSATPQISPETQRLLDKYAPK